MAAAFGQGVVGIRAATVRAKRPEDRQPIREKDWCQPPRDRHSGAAGSGHPAFRVLAIGFPVCHRRFGARCPLPKDFS